MADMGARGDQNIQEQTDWRRLLATLAVGGLVTAICFILGWWWAGTAFLLFTLFLACFAFSVKLRPLVFTVFAVFAVAWLTGALIDQFLPTESDGDPGWRRMGDVESGTPRDSCESGTVVSLWPGASGCCRFGPPTRSRELCIPTS